MVFEFNKANNVRGVCVCVCNGRLLSHKKNEILPFEAVWMDLDTITLTEGSQREKDKHYMILLICGI